MTKEPIGQTDHLHEPKESLEAVLLKAASPSENKDTVRQFADFLEKCFMLEPGQAPHAARRAASSFPVLEVICFLNILSVSYVMKALNILN